MTTRIQFDPDPTRMFGALTEAPAFPGERFYLNIPEVIGDASQFVVTTNLAPGWTALGGGRWRMQAQVEDELDFVLTVTPGFDTVDIHTILTNRSNRTWIHSLAAHCFICGIAPSIGDFECVRHWARTGQQFQRLIELPRKYNPRPTIQHYSVEGAPPGMQIPFVAGFNAVTDVVAEGWLAIQSRDGSRLAAIVSKPALFLFQNMELSCIHSSPSFGTLLPGQTGEALTRIYLVQASLPDWHARMTLDLA